MVAFEIGGGLNKSTSRAGLTKASSSSQEDDSRPMEHETEAKGENKFGRRSRPPMIKVHLLRLYASYLILAKQVSKVLIHVLSYGAYIFVTCFPPVLALCKLQTDDISPRRTQSSASEAAPMCSPLGAVVLSKTEFKHGARRLQLEVCPRYLRELSMLELFEAVDAQDLSLTIFLYRCERITGRAKEPQHSIYATGQQAKPSFGC